MEEHFTLILIIPLKYLKLVIGITETQFDQ